MRSSSRAISLEAREGRPSTSISEYFRCAPRTSRSLRARKGAGNRLHGVGRAHASPETTPVHHAARRRGRRLAARGAGAAGRADAADRCANRPRRGRSGGKSVGRWIPARPCKAGMVPIRGLFRHVRAREKSAPCSRSCSRSPTSRAPIRARCSRSAIVWIRGNGRFLSSLRANTAIVSSTTTRAGPTSSRRS